MLLIQSCQIMGTFSKSVPPMLYRTIWGCAWINIFKFNSDIYVVLMHEIYLWRYKSFLN